MDWESYTLGFLFGVLAGLLTGNNLASMVTSRWKQHTLAYMLAIAAYRSFVKSKGISPKEAAEYMAKEFGENEQAVVKSMEYTTNYFLRNMKEITRK